MEELLERLARGDPVPAAGTALATTTAMALALIEKAATVSREEWNEAGAALVQAGSLRIRAIEAGGEVEETYQLALEALAGQDGELIGRALPAASDALLRLSRLAVDTAELGAVVGERCLPARRADVACACALAETTVRMCRELVRINLTTTGEDDPRMAEARRLISTARSAVDRALAE